MHCSICDRDLSDPEIVYNRQLQQYEPCSTCLSIALDAAYSNGFSPDDDPLDDPELQDDYGNGSVPSLEGSVWCSSFDEAVRESYIE